MKKQEKSIIINNLLRLHRLQLKSKLTKEDKQQFVLYKKIVKINIPKEEMSLDVAKIISNKH